MADSVSEMIFTQLAGPVSTAESLWHLLKASNKHDVDPSRMLVDLGHEEAAHQVEIIQD